MCWCNLNSDSEEENDEDEINDPITEIENCISDESENETDSELSISIDEQQNSEPPNKRKKNWNGVLNIRLLI